MRALSYQKINDLSSAVGLTIPAGATMAWVQAETSNVRYTLDGTTPTATGGLIMRATEPPIELQCELPPARFIEEAGGALLNVIYFG
jgi:hypothetical protein